jgi:hypothetical protein
MDRRSNDPEYQLHEPAEPRDEDQRLSADEFEKRRLEQENSSSAVQQRQNMNQPPPSEVRKAHQDQ